MAVDDLWYLSKRGPDGERLPSKRHGRGKRWRVRYVSPESGQPASQAFDKKSDADRFDANIHADISRGQYVDPRAGRITVAEYAELWRSQQLHRDSTIERTERAIRLHIVPTLGKLPMAAVRPSHLRGWVQDRQRELAASTLHVIYSGILVPMFNAAVLDKVIGATPCVGVKLPGADDVEYYIPKAERVHALYEALPERYRAVVYVAAGCGLRGGEIFGLEVEHVDFLRREVYVRQQLKVVTGRKAFLGPLKTKTSRRTVELSEGVSIALARHLEQHPAVPIEIEDDADPRKTVIRPARLLFATSIGTPVRRPAWGRAWRAAVKAAGLPEGFGLHGLRHYYATVLIFGGANVKTVQLALGHSTPTITLNDYLGYWPDAVDRTRSLVDTALGFTESVPEATAIASAAGQEGGSG